MVHASPELRALIGFMGLEAVLSGEAGGKPEPGEQPVRG
jgi:hypothetical protein